MHIRICLGSSCFARGNGHTTKLLQEYIREKGLTATVELSGALCQEDCSCGPNIQIDGHTYHGVTASLLSSILDRHIAEPSNVDVRPK